MITHGLGWILDALDSLFYHFRGIFFSVGFDVVTFLIVSYGVLASLRLLTNGSLSLSKTIDVPNNQTLRSSSGWSSHGDTNEDISKS